MANFTVNPSAGAPVAPKAIVVDPTCISPNGGSITITSPVGDYRYSKDGGVNWQTTLNFNSLVANTYAISLQRTDDTTCTSQSQFVVNPAPGMPANPIAVATNPTCFGTLGSLTVTQPIGAYEYSIDNSQWKTNTNFTDLPDGNYTIYVHRTGNKLCTSQADYSLQSPPAIPLAPKSLATCSDKNIQLSVEPGYSTYNWFNGNASGTSITTTGNPRAVNETLFVDSAQVSHSKNYFVEARDANGCIARGNVMLTVFSNPKITDITYVTRGEVNVLTDNGAGTPPFTYAIDNDAPKNYNNFTDIPEGDHTIYVVDTKQCSTKEIFKMTYKIYIPNFFTPNHDGVNDRWIIEGIERYPNSEIFIYDRYGKLLIRYLATDEPWDGMYLNYQMPTDAYWYVIHLLPDDQYIKGYVTIKR